MCFEQCATPDLGELTSRTSMSATQVTYLPQVTHLGTSHTNTTPGQRLDFSLLEVDETPGYLDQGGCDDGQCERKEHWVGFVESSCQVRDERRTMEAWSEWVDLFVHEPPRGI